MHIIYHISDLKPVIEEAKTKGKLGFVPTMGALHKGHLSLVKKSIKNNDTTLASIFVNPTQFNNSDDLKSYPRNFDDDCAKLNSEGCDIVFAPNETEMYPVPDKRIFDLNGLGTLMEGKHRPGHFNGVAQIVTKLFDIVEPDNAYFGEKDFQQLAIIRQLVKSYNYPIEIIAGETVREKDGLAMSSRNQLLTKEHRAASPFIYKVLQKVPELATMNSPDEVRLAVKKLFDKNAFLNLEYFELVHPETLEPIHNWNISSSITACIAVFAGKIRLIDNITFNL